MKTMRHAVLTLSCVLLCAVGAAARADENARVPRTAVVLSMDALLERADAIESEHQRDAVQAKVERARDEELRQGRKLLRRNSSSERQAELLFRLAEAYADKAKAVFIREMPAYEAAVDQWWQCIRKREEKDCPAEPELGTGCNV